MNEKKPLVEVSGIAKTFSVKGGNVNALNGISVTIHSGEIVAVIGPSGSGKSTFLRCLNGLEEIDKGTIRINGHLLSYHPRKLREIRTEVGMVFQQFNLFPHLTVWENLALAQKYTRKRKTDKIHALSSQLLKRVGLGDKGDCYPNELSGGEQQRVAIARALAVQPDVMLFDEPTSSLDPELIGEVLEVIRELTHEGMTMVIVTHQLNFAREIAERILFMDEGMVVEDRPCRDFFDTPETARSDRFLQSLMTGVNN